MLYVSADVPPISGSRLESLILEYKSAMALIERLSKRYPRAFLKILIDIKKVDEKCLVNETEMRAIVKQMEELLNLAHAEDGIFKIDLAVDAEKNYWLPSITLLHHGTQTNILINRDLFFSSEYRALTALGEKLHDLLHSDAKVRRGEKEQRIHSFDAAYRWLLNEAKKGQTIQRYKGLGEMNPEQLWETTMDAETRRLLQVTIEDAVSADQIFTTLMGDQVEPRRHFIETNALDVVNLDI
jgi:DNA gyrase subunit B